MPQIDITIREFPELRNRKIPNKTEGKTINYDYTYA